MSLIPGLVTEPSMTYLIFGAIVGSAVFVWVYEKVRGSFASGMAGGAVFGLYAGVLMNFPMWLHLTLYVNWPYGVMWRFTVVGIVVTALNGLLVGLVYDMVGAKASA